MRRAFFMPHVLSGDGGARRHFGLSGDGGGRGQSGLFWDRSALDALLALLLVMGWGTAAYRASHRRAAAFRADAHDALLPRGEVRPRPVPGEDKMSPTTPVPKGDSRRGQGICVSLSRRAAAIWRLSWTLRAARGTTYSSKTLRSSSMQRMLAHIVRTQTI